MQLSLQAVTSKNRDELTALRTAPGQEGYIESVEQCLAEADCRSEWRPVGIYDSGLLVGFAMYGYFQEYKPSGRLWLDRLLIDAHFQGKGYGSAALALLVQTLRQEYPGRDIYLSVYPENVVARGMYQRFGFLPTSEKDTKGEDVFVFPIPQA
ncbi:GNAT family N-acetyltransferase [uncultured Ruthenibacterium sp.]|uniref:GNAT family N-acetyltransferase n=1 Tax=uncultured Ruthenibacterium sp. TaxID=1905347 RepID=UPI00349E770E